MGENENVEWKKISIRTLCNVEQKTNALALVLVRTTNAM